MTARALLPLALAALASCAKPDLCQKPRCSPDRYCDPLDGQCKLLAPKPPPSTDAGTDAGVACPQGCSGATPVCDAARSTCVQCLVDAHCACPTPTCAAATSTCVAPAALSYDGGFGDTCATARPLPIVPCQAQTQFVVDTQAASNDSTGTCDNPTSTGKDVVFTFTLTERRSLAVTARGAPGSAQDPSLYLRQGSCTQGPELACRDGLGQSEFLEVKDLPAGTYYLFLDAFDANAGGPVELTVAFGAPAPNGNETCGTAEGVPFPDGGTQATFVVDTRAATDDLAGSCNALPDSPELVYRVRLDAARDVRVSARAPDGGTAEPVLYFGKSPCGAPASELSCRNGPSPAEVVRLLNQPAGDYYLFVEGKGRAQSGPTLVSVELSPPTPPPVNDVCAGARTIAFEPGKNDVTFVVDPTPAVDDYAGSCNLDEPDSREVVYLLRLGSTYSVTITAQSSDPAVDPVLYLRQSPCDGRDAGTELDCDDRLPGTPEVLALRLLPGDYYLFVEAYGLAGAGATQVTVTLSP